MFRPKIIALREVHIERVEEDSMKTEAGLHLEVKGGGKSCSQASHGLLSWLYSHASYVQCSLLKL